MPTAKQHQAKLDKLTAKIKTRQQELASLREQQKEARARLAEAKRAAKGKPRG